MSFCKMLGAAIRGVYGYIVKVEVDISNGLPVFDMVGLLSSEVREARERVKTSINNSGYTFPSKRVTVNLSPADIRKEGAYFDLPIAVAILCCMGEFNKEVVSDSLFVGELGLNGDVLPVNGILPIIIEAAKMGISKAYVPVENVAEGRVLKNIKIIGVDRLSSLKSILDNQYEIPEMLENEEACDDMINAPDFSDFNGQHTAKRAALIAASGMHNLLLVGPPGTGKSMIAKRIPKILPPMSVSESIEVTCIHSVAGILKQKSLLRERPFRNPHNLTTASALAGGGLVPKPGEISLAHRGVLFLDEFPEFSRQSIEMLRQPLEDRKITISRVGGTYTFPAGFMLVAAMNPCPCGFYPDRNKCNCTEQRVRQYSGKISSPILDRIDIMATLSKIRYEDLVPQKNNTTSMEMRERVICAMEFQKERYKGTTIQFNSELSGQEIYEYCRFGEKEKKVLEEIYVKFELSPRSYGKLIKVSRTIADIEQSKDIKYTHILEAAGYRQSIKGG